MKIGTKLLKFLEKKYVPDTLIERRFGNHDLAFFTNNEGLPVLLFLGKKQANGRIRGERFSRRIVKNQNGVLKDHWDNKGYTC